MTVYLTELDWVSDLGAVEQLTTSLGQAEDIIQSVSSWWPSYSVFMASLGKPVPQTQLTQQEFHQTLAQFIFR